MTNTFETLSYVTQEYKIIESETGGDVQIKENSQYNSLHANTVVVEENVSARLFGSIRTLLIIKTGARVYLHGTLAGEVQNKGGEFHKF